MDRTKRPSINSTSASEWDAVTSPQWGFNKKTQQLELMVEEEAQDQEAIALNEWNESFYGDLPTKDTASDGNVGCTDNKDNFVSDGSTASYYELPMHCKELQELISYRDMNAQIGEVFRACYRYGSCSHSDRLRDAKKIKFYAEAEIKRLEKLCK